MPQSTRKQTAARNRHTPTPSFTIPPTPFEHRLNGDGASVPAPTPAPKPSEGRDRRGRFTTGNLGGPGRPRRTIERQYLAALSEEVSLDAWREVVRYLMAEPRPAALARIAADEVMGRGPDDDILDEAVKMDAERSGLTGFGDNEYLRKRVRKLMDQGGRGGRRVTAAGTPNEAYTEPGPV
jgi:hypothetical protein